jgi:integrase
MAQEFGSLYRDKKASGTWRVIECWIEKKRYRFRGFRTISGRLVKFRNNAEAKTALDQIRADIRHGLDPLVAIADYLPLGATHSSVEHHYKAFCKSKATDPSVKLSRQRIIHLWGHLERGHLDEIKALPIQTLTFSDLDAWVRVLFERTQLGANSIHHIVTDVRTFLRWAARHGVIPAAPEVPVVTFDEHVANPATAAVQERVFDKIPWRLRGAFMAQGFMGLRPSEARNANLADYRFGTEPVKDVLTVPKSKSKRFRLIPVSPPLAKWVREHHPIGNIRDVDSKPTPLFDNPHGHTARWHGSSERRVWLAAMKACGVKHRPSELGRHAFGTITTNRLLAAGYSEGDVSRMVMAIMGHTEVKTSARYVHLDTERLERIVRRGGDG